MSVDASGKCSALQTINADKMQLFFIHSAGLQDRYQGSGAIVAALQAKLSSECAIIAPEISDPENPQYADWENCIAQLFAAAESDVILVGHSFGGSILLKYLAENSCRQTVAGIFIVAAPFWGADPHWDCSDFVLRDDFASTLPPTQHIYFYHSRDDDSVPLAHLKRYADKLPHATTRILDGRGHYFIHRYGFPELVADIQTVVAFNKQAVHSSLNLIV